MINECSDSLCTKLISKTLVILINNPTLNIYLKWDYFICEIWNLPAIVFKRALLPESLAPIMAHCSPDFTERLIFSGRI